MYKLLQVGHDILVAYQTSNLYRNVKIVASSAQLDNLYVSIIYNDKI